MKAKANGGLQSFVDLFLLAKQAENKSPRTIITYRQRVTAFARYLESINIPLLPRVRALHIQGFMATLYQRKVDSSTAGSYFRSLQSFWRWAIDNKIVSASPMEGMRPPVVEKKIVKALTPDQVAGLLERLDDHTFVGARNKAILLLFLDTGIRLAEMINVALDDLTDEAIKVRGKGAKERMVRFGAVTARALLKYQMKRDDTSPWLWVMEDGRQLTREAVRLFFRRLTDDLRKDGIKASPHIWRHTFAITYLRNGGDVFTLQHLLGHSSLFMVQRYLRSLSDSDAMRAHRKFSPVDNMGLK